MIKLINVTRIYNKGTDTACIALLDVNLEIQKGETIAVMGVSGSGKSTLLNILSTIDKPTLGEYFLFDKNICEYSNSDICKIRNEKMGFVLQEYGLLQNDSVFYNVAMPLYLGTKYRRKEIKARVEEVLGQLNILNLKNKKVKKISGGQKQRVAIARAIVCNPEIIFADEPTGALDSTTAKEIMDIFLKLNEDGKTIIMVTHDRQMASYMKRIINIVDGKIDN